MAFLLKKQISIIIRKNLTNQSSLYFIKDDMGHAINKN